MALDSLVAEDLNGIMREIVQGKNNDSGERIRGMCIVGGYRKEGENRAGMDFQNTRTVECIVCLPGNETGVGL